MTTTHLNPTLLPRTSHGFRNRLRRWTAGFMPGLTSHRQAILDLADGYDTLAARAASGGDVVGERCHRLCAQRLREQFDASETDGCRQRR